MGCRASVIIIMVWIILVPVDDNCVISKQLRFFSAAINGFECTSPTAPVPLDGDDTDGGRDGVACTTQSPSIAFEALRLKCSRKLSICTSIDFGVFAIASTWPVIAMRQHTWIRLDNCAPDKCSHYNSGFIHLILLSSLFTHEDELRSPSFARCLHCTDMSQVSERYSLRFFFL